MLMSASICLAELALQVRGDTLRLSAAAPNDALTWAPPGTSNHVRWHAGHALWLQDVLFIEPLTRRTELPAGWAETFGMHCRPVKQTNALRGWPSREKIDEWLKRQLGRVLELLGETPVEMFAGDALPI